MGQPFAKLFNLKTETRILITGLDYAGKTTILHHLFPLCEVISIIPTLCFTVETVQHKDQLTIFSWDVGREESERIRTLWRHYYRLGINAIIFVVDSNDRDRMTEAREELEKILREDELVGVILLVFANKQDLNSAMSISEITDFLGLNLLSKSQRKWFVQSACANTGEGLFEGLDWIASTLKNNTNNNTNNTTANYNNNNDDNNNKNNANSNNNSTALNHTASPL